jgi:hypothetical protein
MDSTNGAANAFGAIATNAICAIVDADAKGTNVC